MVAFDFCKVAEGFNSHTVHMNDQEPEGEIEETVHNQEETDPPSIVSMSWESYIEFYNRLREYNFPTD